MLGFRVFILYKSLTNHSSIKCLENEFAEKCTYDTNTSLISLYFIFMQSIFSLLLLSFTSCYLYSCTSFILFYFISKYFTFLHVTFLHFTFLQFTYLYLCFFVESHTYIHSKCCLLTHIHTIISRRSFSRSQNKQA